MTAIEARQQVQAAIDALVETPRDVEDGLILYSSRSWAYCDLRTLMMLARKDARCHLALMLCELGVRPGRP